jgi:hypothetical protein
MDFPAEISDGLDEIACEANVDLEYWRAEADEWIPLRGYIGGTPNESLTQNGTVFETQTRMVFVRDWQEQLVLGGNPFTPEQGDRIRDGELLLEVMPATTGKSFSGASNIEVHGFVGPDRRTMRIATKVLTGDVQ